MTSLNWPGDVTTGGEQQVPQKRLLSRSPAHKIVVQDGLGQELSTHLSLPFTVQPEGCLHNLFDHFD